MFTIQITSENTTVWEFKNFLENETWAGAKSRVEDMNYYDVEELYNFLEESDMNLDLVQLNDLIWFEWDDIKREMEEED